MKRIVFCAMHGLNGASGSSYSPAYPWSADDELQDFINNHAILDARFFKKSCESMNNSLFQGLFWKGVLEAGLAALKSGKCDDVRVICTKGDAVTQRGTWFSIEAIQSLVNAGDDVLLIPVGKSLGGFDVLDVVSYVTNRHGTKTWRKKTGTISVPFGLLIDPDNLFLPDPTPARVVPTSIEALTVVRQENPNRKNNLMPKGLCGRKILRKNGSHHGIVDFCFPLPPLAFPDNDPQFAGREVTHWTIDEHMVLIGHPEAGTIGSVIDGYMNQL